MEDKIDLIYKNTSETIKNLDLDELQFFYSYFKFEYTYECKYPSANLNDRLSIIKIYKLIGIELKKRVCPLSYYKDSIDNGLQYKKVSQL